MRDMVKDTSAIYALPGDEIVKTKSGYKTTLEKLGESFGYDLLIYERAMERNPKTRQEFFTAYEAEAEETFLLPFEDALKENGLCM